MSHSRFYDTVAFDVRDNATMLFFASTSETGDIKDYLLLMRSIEENFDATLYVEMNEDEFVGNNLLKAADLLDNTLTLVLREPAKKLGNAESIVVTFEATENNLSSMETGSFRVLGDVLRGGNA